MRPSRRLWPVSVVVGVALGAFSLLADGIVGGRLFGILGNIASPWGLAAFFVGRLTTRRSEVRLRGPWHCWWGSRSTTGRRGARIHRRRGDLVWTAIALVAGPVMGWSGAAISSEPERPPILAVVAPSGMLVAEAIFLAIDRKVWHYDLGPKRIA